MYFYNYIPCETLFVQLLHFVTFLPMSSKELIVFRLLFKFSVEPLINSVSATPCGLGQPLTT